MKQGQKLTSEEGRELLQNLAVDEKSKSLNKKINSMSTVPLRITTSVKCSVLIFQAMDNPQRKVHPNPNQTNLQ